MKQAPPVCESGIACAPVGTHPGGMPQVWNWVWVWIWAKRLLLALSLLLYVLHFVHPGADFPGNSPWNDWSKYTDEGWYGDGAIRHFVLGHWLMPGDFNPAVAMPVWPLLEAGVFAFTGVSVIAARALTVGVFGITLLALYGLLQRRTSLAKPAHPQLGAPLGLGAPLAVFLLCANPFLFAFDRLAILEPLVAALGMSVLWLASSLWSSPGTAAGRAGKAVGLGLLLALLGLSKPTAVALFPAVLYLLWRLSRGRWRAALRLASVPVLLALAIWTAYFLLLMHNHLLEDYRYLFDANAYTGFRLQPLAEVVRNTLWDGRFMGAFLYSFFAFAMAVMLLFRRRFFREPVVGTLLVWAGAYLLLLGYHNNLQPRYYLLLAVPVLALLAMAMEDLLAWAMAAGSTKGPLAGFCAAAVCVGFAAVAGIRQEVDYLRHPEYSYLAAAREIAKIVRADPGQSPWILSVSGSDLTLMTGLPSIDDDFGTLDLDQRVRAYRPGWYVAWNQIDDDKMDALRPLYHPVRVAAFPAMDDPDRNLLILYRLDPASAGAVHHGKRRLPPALRTRHGQQPGAPQLRH